LPLLPRCRSGNADSIKITAAAAATATPTAGSRGRLHNVRFVSILLWVLLLLLLLVVFISLKYSRWQRCRFYVQLAMPATKVLPPLPCSSLSTNKLVQFQCFLHKYALFACLGASTATVVLSRSHSLSQYVRSFGRSFVRSFSLLLCECVQCTGVHLLNLSVTVSVHDCTKVCVCVLCLLACLPAGCFFSAGQFICDFSMAD